MKLEHQVCSLELARKLKDLGVKQESYFYWQSDAEEYWKVKDGKKKLPKRWVGIGKGDGTLEDFSAFTLAELVLPIGYYSMQVSQEKFTCYDDTGGFYDVDSDTEADARAKMRIHLIEKGIVKP